MRVCTFRTVQEQERGVLPFIMNDGYIPNVVFFFPFTVSNIISGMHMRRMIRAYALDMNFKPIRTVFGTEIRLKPGDVLRLPPDTIHVVETSMSMAPISNFDFLKKELGQ